MKGGNVIIEVQCVATLPVPRIHAHVVAVESKDFTRYEILEPLVVDLVCNLSNSLVIE